MRYKTAFFISLSSVFAMLENLTKLFLIAMCLDNPVFILISLTFAINIIYGLDAHNVFARYHDLLYEEWEEFNQILKKKKYPSIFTFW